MRHNLEQMSNEDGGENEELDEVEELKREEKSRVETGKIALLTKELENHVRSLGKELIDLPKQVTLLKKFA